MEPNPKDIAKEPLPPIPAKRYFTIGEVSELCGVKPHVLRYWEQEFTSSNRSSGAAIVAITSTTKCCWFAVSASCSTAKASPSAARAIASKMDAG
jgi:hypothetical protein